MNPHVPKAPQRSSALNWALVYLAVSVVLFVLFQQGALERLDQWAFDFAESLHTPWLNAFMSAATHLGGGEVLAPLGLLAVIWFLWKGYRMEALLIAVTLLVGDLLNDWLKEWVARPRPSLGWGISEVPDSYSFPSGHAMAGMAFYGMLAYVVQTVYGHTPWVKVVAPVTILVVTLIAASRVYLGVHYLSDVLAGLAAAAVWYHLLRHVYENALQRWHTHPGRPLTPGR